MRIGIDIDGVLTDIEKWQYDYASKFYYENYNKKIIDYQGYETNDLFKVGPELDHEFWKKYYKDYSINIEVRRFASEVIRKLKDMGNEIYIITARGSFLTSAHELVSIEENNNIVINWLKKNDIYYDKIIFSPKDKLNICLEHKIDIMIEDKPKNIEDISTIIPVICFNANYNEKCLNDNIIRCYSWYDIYANICERFS